MPIITISRGSYNKAKDVAEKVAQKLGYRCVARDDVLQTSDQFNFPEARLIRGLEDATSVLDQFAFGRKKYRAFIQAALLKQFQNDNFVYHGLAGHFFLRGIRHVLNVRIIADMEDRVRDEMLRSNISHKEALAMLRKDDEERRKWSLSLYNIDTRDPGLYDMVILIKKMTTDNAADIICDAATLPQFQSTQESQQEMDDLVLASQVIAALVPKYPDIKLQASNGNIVVYAADLGHRRDIEKIAKTIPGVKAVNLQE